MVMVTEVDDVVTGGCVTTGPGSVAIGWIGEFDSVLGNEETAMGFISFFFSVT